MPSRKEPKEQVVYAASTRKAPPFKPQRPSQMPRIPTAESESSKAGPAKKKTAPRPPSKKKPAPSRIAEESEDDDEDGDDASSATMDGTTVSRPAAAPKRKALRELSPMDVSSDDAASPPPKPASATEDRPPAPSQADNPVIPQALLVRLLHEHFADKDTKIDKHAIEVLQKYFEVFVRETIARASAQKQEDAAKSGNGDEVDVGWLELEDLEKVMAGMMLDF